MKGGGSTEKFWLLVAVSFRAIDDELEFDGGEFLQEVEAHLVRFACGQASKQDDVGTVS